MEKLLYALQDNQLVSINDVPSGQNCNCICPACKQPLVAKKGNIRIHHFAHARNSDCKYGYETSSHLLAKEIISNATYITLPIVTFGSYNTMQILESRQVKIKDVKCELFLLDNIKPDIIIDTEEGKIIIEIYVTHKVDDNKLKKIRNLGIDSIEIDLSKQKELVDKSLLTNILLEDNPLKNWIFNKKQESVKEDFILKKSMLEKCIYQWKNKPSWAYCISECEYFLDNIDDEGFYCKQARAIKEGLQNRSPVFCRECGCIMNLEYGKFGAYYVCTGCFKKKSSPENDKICPKCKSRLVLRKHKYDRFLGCEKFPSCNYTEKYKK